MPDIEKALRTVREGRAEGSNERMPIVLLAHRPAGAERHAAAGVDIQLSGHTHGGHLAPLQWFISRYNEGFISGLYDVGRMKLYVSNGAGLWAGFAARLGVPSEITLLRLTRK